MSIYRVDRRNVIMFDKVTLKFNKNISDFFQSFTKNIELQDGENNRFSIFLKMFDINQDNNLNASEVKSIWQKVCQNSKQNGDEFILSEEDSQHIIEEYSKNDDSEIKKNFIYFIKHLYGYVCQDESLKYDFTGNIKYKKENDITYEYNNGYLQSKKYKDGTTETFYANGIIQKQYKLNGDYVEYYSSGKIHKKINEDGSFILYYEDGSIKAKGNETDYTYYYENKQIMKEKKDNIETSYYQNGQVKISESGREYTSYYENGQVKYTNVDGIKEYYPNGQIKFVTEPSYIEYYENGKVKLESKNGTVVEYDDLGNIKENNNSNKIFDICNRIKIALSNNPPDIKYCLNSLNIENITDVVHLYDGDLIESINDIENNNDKQKLMNYMADLLHKIYVNNIKDVKEYSQIKNEYYEGKQYNVRWTENIVYIRNKDSNIESQINLDILCKDYNECQKYILLMQLQELPGEVLDDIANDVTFIDKTISKAHSGEYSPNSDTIQLQHKVDIETIVHEIGHSLDNIFASNTYRTKNKEFLTYFEEEKMINSYKQYYGSGYASTDEKEFFAECYALMMLGDDKSKECIENRFPKSFAIIKEMIQEIRQLPPEVRHRQDLT